jgi:hypothetical protein
VQLGQQFVPLGIQRPERILYPRQFGQQHRLWIVAHKNPAIR